MKGGLNFYAKTIRYFSNDMTTLSLKYVLVCPDILLDSLP